MVVAVIVVNPMKAAIDDKIDVIAVRDGFTSVRIVTTPARNWFTFIFIFIGDFYLVLFQKFSFLMVEMSRVQIVHMPMVKNGRMAAAGSMFVVVSFEI